MRYALALLALALASCSSVGPGPSPGPSPTPYLDLAVVVRASGEGDVRGHFGLMQLSLVRWHGNGSITIRPIHPYLTFDGDSTWVVEPAPGKEREAQHAVRTGAILIRRNGVPGALNAPGTIAASQGVTP